MKKKLKIILVTVSTLGLLVSIALMMGANVSPTLEKWVPVLYLALVFSFFVLVISIIIPVTKTSIEE